jgi:hypothetical protein
MNRGSFINLITKNRFDFLSCKVVGFKISVFYLSFQNFNKTYHFPGKIIIAIFKTFLYTGQYYQ